MCGGHDVVPACRRHQAALDDMGESVCMADERVLVVTATYNERANVAEFHRRLREAVPSAHLVVVDDNSPDGTAEAVQALAEEDPRVSLISRPGKLGYASAHQAGMKLALEEGATAVVTLDADLSHDPAAIPSMLDALRVCDVVVGSRYVTGGGMEGVGGFRQALSRFANSYVRALTGLRAHDCTSGFRAYRAGLIEDAGLLRSGPEGYVFLTEALWRCQRAEARICEVPITYHARRAGASKMSVRIIVESGWRTLVLRLRG
jgi:dolichol-phosphate mannosyltransferase